MKKTKAPIRRGVARVPVVMQMEKTECGAAALAMVLAYYGKWISLEQARQDCGVSRDGANARNLALAAQNYGLTVNAYRIRAEQMRNECDFPCIIAWNDGHYVVLCGFRGARAVINDPARGSCMAPMAEFNRAYSGVCLTFQPNGGFEPGGKRRGIFAYACDCLRGTGASAAFVAVTTVVATLLGIVQPTFARVFVDRLLTPQNPEWFRPFLIALCAFAIAQLAVCWIQSVYALQIDGKLASVNSAAYFWKVLCMPMSFFRQRMAGDIQSRQASNVSISHDLVYAIAPLALNAMMMVFYLVVMLRYSATLTAVGMVSVCVNLLFSIGVARKRVNIARIQARDAGKLSGTAVAGIEMMESIQASGAENGFFAKWAEYQASVRAQSMKLARFNLRMGALPGLVSALTNALVMMLGVYMVMRGNFTVGMIIAFQSFLSAFANPANALIHTGQTLQEMQARMARVEDVMKHPSDSVLAAQMAREPREDEDADKLSGAIALRHVCFGYARLSPPLIEDFSLDLRTGSCVAIVGPSGCGKSTLLKLISGLYAPWSGEILFDGKPIGEIDRSVFTSSLAVVDQEPVLFEDTIANNIKMWDRSIEDFEMIMAARDARLHEDIMQREGGYRSSIAEDGKDLSGGQRQRMEIARVLAQDPTIIIMDEATSAMDAKTEYEVVKSIRERGVTCIIVSHRLSAIRDCDEIIVMDGGAMIERGTHAALCAKGGAYAALIASE